MPYAALAAALGARRARRAFVPAPAVAVLVLALPLAASWRLARARAAPDTLEEAAAWVAANVDPSEKVLLTSKVDLPLGRTLAGLEYPGWSEPLASRRFYFLPWSHYLGRLVEAAGPAASPEPRFDLHWLPVDQQAYLEDAAGFIAARRADYAVAEVFGDGRQAPVGPSLTAGFRAAGELLARISPDGRADRSEHPFGYQDETSVQSPSFTLRALQSALHGAGDRDLPARGRRLTGPARGTTIQERAMHAPELHGARVGVVIPAYRVERQIQSVLRAIPAWVEAIFVVDDQSPDQVAARVEELGDPRVTLIRHAENRGVGGAMRSGFRAALERGLDLIVKMDGDDQMDPAYLPELVQPLVDGRADFTKGNRYASTPSLKQMPLVRLLGNAGLTFLVKLSSGYWNIFDPANGYIAIRSAVLSRIELARLPERYFFESGFLIELGKLRAVIRDVPIPARYADEHSSLSVTHTLMTFPPRLLWGLGRRLFWRYFVHDFAGLLGLLPARRAVARLGRRVRRPGLARRPAERRRRDRRAGDAGRDARDPRRPVPDPGRRARHPERAARAALGADPAGRAGAGRAPRGRRGGEAIAAAVARDPLPRTAGYRSTPAAASELSSSAASAPRSVRSRSWISARATECGVLPRPSAWRKPSALALADWRRASTAATRSPRSRCTLAAPLQARPM